jgi:hypothetical protein
LRGKQQNNGKKRGWVIVGDGQEGRREMEVRKQKRLGTAKVASQDGGGIPIRK